jgi:hypothetical protein
MLIKCRDKEFETSEAEIFCEGGPEAYRKLFVIIVIFFDLCIVGTQLKHFTLSSLIPIALMWSSSWLVLILLFYFVRRGFYSFPFW